MLTNVHTNNLEIKIGNYYLIEMNAKDEEVLLRIIPPEEVELIDLEYKRLFEYQYFRRKVQEITLNFQDFLNKYGYYKAFAIKEKYEEGEFQEKVYVDLNRILINSVTSLKAFIEHYEKRLIKKYSKESKEYTFFKAKTKNWYEGHFAYRFLIRLRDYSIHAPTFPIDKVEIIEDFPSNQPKEFDVFFNKIKILKNKTMSQKFKEDYELAQYNNFFPVNPIINKAIKLLEELLPTIVKCEEKYFSGAANIINNLYVESIFKNNMKYGILITDNSGEMFLTSKVLLVDSAKEIESYLKLF